MNVKIKDLILDKDVQQRARMDIRTVRRYMEDMERGKKFPPVTAFSDGEKTWVADGFHRAIAARTLKFTELETDVREGGKREAILFAVGTNDAHGLPRTNADKRKAAETMLRDSQWGKWSDNEIARKCAVSNKFIGKMRKKLFSSLNGSKTNSKSAVRKCADGRTRNISRIGGCRDNNGESIFDNTIGRRADAKTGINSNNINKVKEYYAPDNSNRDEDTSKTCGDPQELAGADSPAIPDPIELVRATIREAEDHPLFLMSLFQDMETVDVSSGRSRKSVADYRIGPSDIRRFAMGDDILNVLSSGGAILIHPVA